MSRFTATTALLFLLSSAFVSADDLHQVESFLEPWADIQLAASEMGILTRVEVQEGDVVEIGQVLASLDDTVLLASLKVAESSRNARGSLESAVADLETRQVELKKLQQLRSRAHASQKEVDRVAGEVRIAKARVQAVREELQVKQLEYERIQAQLDGRRIRSTINGVVTEVKRDQGEFVSPSDPTVARVVQLDPLRVFFSVPVAHRSAIEAGQTMTITIGDAAETAEARVEFVSPTADASSGTFRVKVRLPNPDGRWHAGSPTVLVLDKLPSTTPRILARRPR